jgi:hypothetical protein
MRQEFEAELQAARNEVAKAQVGLSVLRLSHSTVFVVCSWDARNTRHRGGGCMPRPLEPGWLASMYGEGDAGKGNHVIAWVGGCR